MTLDLSSSILVLYLMMSAQISSGLAPQCLKMLDHSSSSLGLHCQKAFDQISSNLVSQMSQRRLLASLQAPILKDKKGVRFSALYLQQKEKSYYWKGKPSFGSTENTLTRDAKTRVYSFQVDEHWLTLSADLLRKALNVTPADSAHPFESPPAGKTDITFTRRRVPSNWLMKMKVAIREPAPQTTRKLPVVEVKRWIIASQDETIGPSVHPEDATSTKMVRETLSHEDAESGVIKLGEKCAYYSQAVFGTY
ncbi:hypothetical protein Tco_1494818 [Tanacetum coccineum]